MASPQKTTYEGVGIRYAAMDPWKVRCQAAAAMTAHSLARHGLQELNWTRGESAYLIEASDRYFAHVQEGLGTKNLVADEIYSQTGQSHYDAIAQDLVAMIINDLCTLGAAPVSVALHVAVGDSAWFEDRKRTEDFIRGFADSCINAGATWGPGESPTLPQVVSPDTVELSGSAFGMIYPKHRLIKPSINGGDSIILVSSSGIHSNGLSLARSVAKRLELGYLTPCEDGVPFGLKLLAPTLIYSPLIERLLDRAIPISYAVHITGHGWRKLMRHSEPFEYTITQLPDVTSEFRLIQNQTGLSNYEMYQTFNMGAGFAIFSNSDSTQHILNTAQELGFSAWVGGTIKESETAKVTLLPLEIEYSADTLKLR